MVFARPNMRLRRAALRARVTFQTYKPYNAHHEFFDPARRARFTSPEAYERYKQYLERVHAAHGLRVNPTRN